MLLTPLIVYIIQVTSSKIMTMSVKAATICKVLSVVCGPMRLRTSKMVGQEWVSTDDQLTTSDCGRA